MSKYRYKMECADCGEVNQVINHRAERTLATCYECNDVTTHELTDGAN
jgi:predicted nucleic acid-binding Zn ribbon protein